MILFSPASNYSMILVLEESDLTSCGRFRERPRVSYSSTTNIFLARALRASTERPPAIDVRSGSSSRPHPELVCRFQSLNSRSLRTQSRLLSLSLAAPATTKKETGSIGTQANESIRCGELGPVGAEPEIGDISVRNAAAGSTHRHERLACDSKSSSRLSHNHPLSAPLDYYSNSRGACDDVRPKHVLFRFNTVPI
jgi:hypothetical protein